MPVTQRQIRQLAPYLEGDAPTHINVDKVTGAETREWNLVCPLHPDQTRSASLNIDKGVFYCFVCGGMPITALIRRHDEWLPREGGGNPDLNGKAPKAKQRVLTDGMIAGWHSALVSNEAALRWLKERRGLSMESITRFQLGYENGRLYTIPVRSEAGEIWNVRFYNPNPQGETRKIWSEPGYGSPARLFPINILNSDPEEIIIGEGEWDVILALQFGYDAVTRTGAADVWDNAWGEWFTGRKVYLCHDRDKKGQKADGLVARGLHRIADVRMVELPYPIVEKHGQDLTDFLLENEPTALRQLMDEAKPYGKPRARESAVETVTVLDTFDARRVGEPVRVITTIRGRKEPGYTIPKKMHMVCTQDAGNKCTSCPLNAASGDAHVVIEPDDPVVLALIDASTEKVYQELASAYGVPSGRCVKLQQEVEEHQAVEILFGRPALDHTEGNERDSAGDYKNIKLTSVGKHDTASNNTVSAVGSLQPSPRSQGNEFLVHEIEVLETSVDKFVIDKESVALMKRFQTSGKPLNKLAEINKSLAEHVTKIHGRPEMHALMDLTFHSVLSFNFAGETIPRGWIESLIVGDTGTGKSSAASRLVQHYGGGEVINCEAATFAGVVGGVQQLGGKDWAVTWGAIPINDRRLVVLDEVSGLSHEDIGGMSDVRSRGQAKLTKVVQDTTWARVRQIWMGNPREATMDRFTYGVDALKPLIGNAEDIARFDMAMAVTKFDVPAEVINTRSEGGEFKYTEDACHTLLMWAWTRKPDQVIWSDDAEVRVFDAANEMGKLYVEDPPLVLASSVRLKIARIAVAMAARLFSTDAKHECVVVKKEHVDGAVQFLNLIYGMTAFGYRERSRERLADRHEAISKKEEVKQYLLGRPALAKFLRGTGKFRRQDVEEILNYSREEANGVINSLWEARMVRKELGDIRVEPTLHELLREVKW